MLNQLLQALRQFAKSRREEARKGLCTYEFAASLVKIYSDSMLHGITMIGKDSYVTAVRSEADRLISVIYPRTKHQDSSNKMR